MRRRKNRHASVAPFGLGPDADPDEATRVDESDGRIMDALDSEIPLESLTFENYFPGKVNAFTFKVAQAVATAPGGDYNPLFLYGTVGCGKTHLISAIGNTILTGGGKKSKGPAPRVGYVSASHFARRLADAVAEFGPPVAEHPDPFATLIHAYWWRRGDTVFHLRAFREDYEDVTGSWRAGDAKSIRVLALELAPVWEEAFTVMPARGGA